MSFKAMILLNRRSDMSNDQFKHWWLNEHAPLAKQLPGVRKIVFNFPRDGQEFDGIAELWFDSEADFLAAYDTEFGKSVAADSIAHVNSRTRLFVEEQPIFGD